MRAVVALTFVAGCASFSTTAAPPAPDAGPTDAGHVVVVNDAGAPEDSSVAPPAEAAAPGIDYAVNFTGNGYADVADLAIPTDFTLEAWILPSPNNTSDEQDILAKDRDSASDTQCRLVLRADNSIYFTAADANRNSHGLTTGPLNTRNLSSDSIDLGKWTHVAVTKKGTTTTLLLNGKTVKTVVLDGDFTIPDTVHFRIGARYGLSGNNASSNFLGAFDDVRVWSVARSEGDIQSTMNEGALPADTAGLVADYAFVEGAGTAIASTTGTHPATLVSGTWIPSTR